jgi:hypothetical protein
MTSRPTTVELKDRIEADISHFGGALPERAALVWDGYLAALLEWDLITPSQHKELSELLPKIDDNPVIGIFLGRG